MLGCVRVGRYAFQAQAGAGHPVLPRACVHHGTCPWVTQRVPCAAAEADEGAGANILLFKMYVQILSDSELPLVSASPGALKDFCLSQLIKHSLCVGDRTACDPGIQVS